MNSESTTQKVIGIVAFIVLVIAFSFDQVVGLRFLGFAELAWGVWVATVRRVSFGIEGRPPAGYIPGIPAIVLGCLAAALGVFLIAEARMINAIFTREN